MFWNQRMEIKWSVIYVAALLGIGKKKVYFLAQTVGGVNLNS